MKHGIVGEPVLLDKMDAKLVGKVVQAIIDDNQRAKKAREERQKARAEKRKSREDADDRER
ncbi:MAG: hypothetical protein R3B72_21595 [Polyangiaceae bacterium]